jgi:uncharacterized protein (TIGR02996 family)
MTREEAFLLAIIDEPEDDGLRLIFADWLEEQCDPRGEFIHVQMELARGVTENRLRRRLKARERELLEAHAAEWLGPLRGLVRRCHFRRGFLADVDIPMGEGHYRAPCRVALSGVTPIDWARLEVPREVVEYMPESVARENLVIPLGWPWQGTLLVAMNNPGDRDMLDKLQFIFNRYIAAVPVPAEVVREAIDRHYGQSETESVDCVLYEFVDTAIDFSQWGEDGGDHGWPLEGDAPIVKLVNLIVQEAINLRASDIHIEPFATYIRVRYRIDGELVERDNPPRRLLAPILSRIKIMAGIDLGERRRPQEGRFRIHVAGQVREMAVSLVPTRSGQAAVLSLAGEARASG